LEVRHRCRSRALHGRVVEDADDFSRDRAEDTDQALGVAEEGWQVREGEQVVDIQRGRGR
jgi:hypothetical protein